MTRNGEGPAVQSEAFENTSTPNEEQNMNNPIIPDEDEMRESANALQTLAEIRERNLAARATWLAGRPEVAALKPDWAVTLEVDDLDGVEGVDLWAERDFGPMRLVAHASYRDGQVTWDDGTTAPNVVIERAYVEELTVEQMRELASALMAAIPVVEAAQVHP